MADFATLAIALYASHHAGDYWVQTDHQSQCKGKAGTEGRINCLKHVSTYILTQAAFLAVTDLVVGLHAHWVGMVAGLLVSAVTHYMADRREFGLMFKLARLVPGKARFMTLGVPRAGRDDNPSLGTGTWALDQSWHIFWGVFVAALAMVAI